MIDELLVTLFKGTYPYFSLIAIAVIIFRIKKCLWTPAESIVLIFFCVNILMVVAQIFIADDKLEVSRRYLLPSAPLLFGWTAWGIYALHTKINRKVLLWGVFLVGTALLLDGWNGVMKDFTSDKKFTQRQVTYTAAEFIKRDYCGVKMDAPIRNLDIYHSPFRPVVWSDYSALGYFSGGRGEPSAFEEKPDYWVLPSEALPHGKELHRFIVKGREYVIYGE